MKCPACGYMLPEDSAFCQYCGNKIDLEQNRIDDAATDSLHQDNTSIEISSYENPPSAESSNNNLNGNILTISKDTTTTPPNKSTSKNQIISIITKIVAGVIGAAIGHFYWEQLIYVLIIAGIMYLIMCKCLKMKGPELKICFLVILHAAILLIGIGLLIALKKYSIGFINDFISTDLSTYYADIVFSIILIALCCIFYVKRSKWIIIALLSIESLCMLANACNLYLSIIESSDQIGIILWHIAWRIITIYLMVRYLKQKKTQRLSLEMTQKKTIDDPCTLCQDDPELHTVQTQGFCRHCGGIIDLQTKQCISCGKQYSRFNKKTFIAIFTVLLITLTGLNAYQYISYSRTLENNNLTISDLKTQIDASSLAISDLKKQLKTNDVTIASQKITISDQKNKICKLDDKAFYFDRICSFLSSGNIGYAADNFKVNSGIIVVNKLNENKKITLTAYWNGGGTVSTSNSSLFTAEIEFDDNSWYKTTTLKIIPYSRGVTIITFSNDVDSKTFKIMIIVTE